MKGLEARKKVVSTEMLAMDTEERNGGYMPFLTQLGFAFRIQLKFQTSLCKKHHWKRHKHRASYLEATAQNRI